MSKDQKTMAKRFKKFDGGKKLDEYDPLGFELGGEEFNCHPAIQGAVFLDFVEKSDDEGSSSAAALYEFLQSAMPEEEYDRLQKLLHSDDVIFEIDVIGDVVKYLVEEYSSRPTQEPTT